METSMGKLLNLIDFNDDSINGNGKIEKLEVNLTEKSWTFYICFKEVNDLSLYKEFVKALDKISSIIPDVKKVNLIIRHDSFSKEDLHYYYDYVIDLLSFESSRINAIRDFDIDIEGNVLYIVCPKDAAFVSLLRKNIETELNRIGFDIEVEVKLSNNAETITDRIKKQQTTFINDAIDEIKSTPVKPKYESLDPQKPITGMINQISSIPMDEISLQDYKDMYEKANFIIEGVVVSTDLRQLNNQTMLLNLIVTDYNDSIYVSKFIRNDKEFTFYSKIAEGQGVKVKGYAQFNMYSGEVVLNALNIEKTPNVLLTLNRTDKGDIKRVELHLHSKMSTLDGITSIKDYVKQAKKWGHKALALTEHGNVQSFPDLYNITRDKEIKPIYGVELSFVDENSYKIALNESDISLIDATYVVFDIETTGLSTNFDDIIEIAAVKINNGQIIEEFSKFINPNKPIPAITTKITSITDADVCDAETVDIVLKEFKDWSNNAILVAHNANFDMGHLYENYKKIGIYDGLIPTIDTLQIARVCYSDKLKRFNLKAVSKHFKVNLSQHHRAIYDAKATGEVFLHMLKDIKGLGIKKHNQINMLIEDNEAYKYAIPSHINLLVRNEEGLKNLYKIVSDANTKRFYKEPRLMKSFLDTHRGGLLVGSGCMNGDFFETALNKPYDELKQKAKYFDYLEVQPLTNYSHFEENMDNSQYIVKETIKRIIQVGKELNIPVVATGDVHHMNDSDKTYREIYVSTPKVGGGRHPLAYYKDIPSQYFMTTDEMLKAFNFLGNELAYEIVVTNTNLIADLVEFVEAFKPDLYAPTDDFLSHKGVPSIEKKVVFMTYKKAKELYGEPLPRIVHDRISKELKSITENKFSTVYYISHLLCKKSLDEGYLVGSRGSVGSSFVATLMDITEVNPLPPHYVCPKCSYSSFKMTGEEKALYGIREDEIKFQKILYDVESGFDLPNNTCPNCGYDLKKDGHDIPFETFLGFKGDKVPDIDLNFSGDYQPVVHEYIREIFGHNYAFRAGTISTVAKKTAFGYVRGYLEDKGLKMRKAEIERRAKAIEGVKRSTGQHPGGIVVVPNFREITDVTPVQYPADDTNSNWRTTHFDYHSFEANLFKLDVLGHDDPTMIRFLMDYAQASPIDFPFSDARDIPVDDPEVYKLLNSTDVIGLTPKCLNSHVVSFGIPEFGTGFVRSMLKDSRPTTFAELVKISGLSHGTDVWLNNAQELVLGKNKKFQKVNFKDVIGCRDDIMVYLIQHGLDAPNAFAIMEFVRKGKTGGNPLKWSEYVKLMREKNIPEWYIWSCGQIKYMFPKAHATAYVIMAMRIAWFKLYRPIYFYSAYFSKRASDFDVIAFIQGEYGIDSRINEINDKGNNSSAVEKSLIPILEIALEMCKRGFSFRPIDLEKSHATDFIISDDKKSLILPFVVVDNLGLNVAASIVEARNEKSFTTKEDVKKRTKLSKTLFEKLETLDVFKDLPDDNQISFDLKF